jgi:hypothetical protein
MSVAIEIKSGDVNVEDVMRQIRERIEQRKKDVMTEEEVREIAEHRLNPVLETHDFGVDFLRDFRAEPARWNFAFGPDTIYRSSRGALGRALEAIRGALRPLQKLFWNPNPMISALSRQSDLNKYYVHLLHNLTLEVTRLNLEIQDLKNRNLELQGRLELQVRREKKLESMVVFREGGEGGGEPR